MGRHVRFREFLKCRRDRAMAENRAADFAWVKECWQPIKSYRTVKRGKKKGWLVVELFYPKGKKRTIPERYMRYKEIDYAERAYAE